MSLRFKQRYKKKQQSLVRRVLLNISIFTFLGILIFIGIFIHRRYQTFQDRKEEIRVNILKRNMEDISNETNAAYRYIQYSRKSHKDQLVERLKVEVKSEYSFIDYYHSMSVDKKKNQKTIADLINYYRTSDKHDDLFIMKMNGVMLVNKNQPELEGKLAVHHEDISGKKVYNQLTENLKKREEVLLKLQSSEHPRDSLFSGKIIFARKFTPLGLIIGKTLIPSNHVASIKQDILTFLSDIRFGDEGYVFVNTYDGHALIKDGEIVEEKPNIWNLTDPNGVKVIQEEYRAAQIPGGDYIFYSWRKLKTDEIAPKVSFIRGLDSFEWMIGSGSYIDIISDKIETEQQQLEVELMKDIVFIFISLMVLLIIAFIVIRNYFRLTKENVNHFTNFFDQAGKKYIRIDKSALKFSEFAKLADAANSMIDDKEKLTRQMDKERLLFRYIIDSIPDLIVYKKMDGTYQGCNKAFEKAFGLYSKDITDKKAGDIYPENQSKKFLELDKKLIEKGQPVRKEEWLTLPNDHNYLYDIYKTFYYDNEGNALGIIAIARDITEKEMNRMDLKKALAKADEANRIKTTFLENLSHEIRTPLNAISGFSSLIRDEELTLEEISSSLIQISRASDRILKVIESILNLSRIQVGEIYFKEEKVNLHRLTKELTNGIKERFQNDKPDIELDVRIDQCPADIIADEYWLGVAIDNLLDNALKFTQYGKVVVECLKEQNSVKLAIRDTGIGIPGNSEKLIFDYFTQITNPMNKKYQGTGCGLFISKYIVEHHGGEIWYESEEGTGTTFYMTIPYGRN